MGSIAVFLLSKIQIGTGYWDEVDTRNLDEIIGGSSGLYRIGQVTVFYMHFRTVEVKKYSVRVASHSMVDVLQFLSIVADFSQLMNLEI